MSSLRKQHNQYIAVGLVKQDARQRIAEATKHIANAQDRAVARFNLWAKEPD